MLGTASPATAIKGYLTVFVKLNLAILTIENTWFPLTDGYALLNITAPYWHPVTEDACLSYRQ
jgi:hypothetical protein